MYTRENWNNYPIYVTMSDEIDGKAPLDDVYGAMIPVLEQSINQRGLFVFYLVGQSS
jgi:hypothetical protein